METIRLIKSIFYHEEDTKRKLCSFIIDSKKLSMDSECKKFEENFARFQNRKYGVFVSTGSSANLLLVQALLNTGKLKKGDQIGVSALTWPTNIMPLIQLGLTPILIDCEINTINVSLSKIKAHKINALFLTNTLGFCSDIDYIKEYCEKKNILFVEDNCESLGSEYKGIKLGNFGFASTFSFFVGHHLSTIEGGMVCTDDKELYENLLISRAHGWSRDLPVEKQKELREKYNIPGFYNKYTFYDLAYNMRPCEINGFIGNIQINYIDEIIKKRENNFKRVNKAIKNNKGTVSLDLNNLTTISNFGIPFIFKSKELFKKYKIKFEENLVEIRPIISGNTANQPFFKKYCSPPKACKNADFIHQNGFYCGNNPEMTEEEINKIISLIENE